MVGETNVKYLTTSVNVGGVDSKVGMIQKIYLSDFWDVVFYQG